jgi:hypothetical protein
MDDSRPIQNLLDSLSIEAQPAVFSDEKLPCEVNYLIQQYHNQTARKSTRIESFAAYLDSPLSSVYTPIITKTKVAPHVQFNNTPSRLATQNSELLSIANLPPLPKLLRGLAGQSTQAMPFSMKHNNWTFQVPNSSYSQLLGKLVKPSFWYPRTRGECYSLGVARYENHVFIYGAQDMFAKNREQWCSDVVCTNSVLS